MRLLYIMRGARPKRASYNACIGGACPKYAPRIFYVGTTPSRPQKDFWCGGMASWCREDRNGHIMCFGLLDE